MRNTTQMAENGKNRLAILTIFRCRRTDVNLDAFLVTENKRSPCGRLGRTPTKSPPKT
ncbi:hypothetical protein VB774_19390 [Pseudanabaena galeata UHCC 0370]|uniref:Uncharacterized protein n=1 Tax=Pseudanabaena galeata UHCC 0370 TaxID=3110310 RepID=A0ABU5TNR4_9CYAN|nr:hypothetical protein [Pseudanabaena galeata]MEA5479794.1 hypothetical protein [Pseudanabaena galeata UHCC 0370]